MAKLQCSDVCLIELHPQKHICCCQCEHIEKCKENGDICDSWELGIEHCPLTMEVEE
jgi:hypothetical protein